MHVRTCERVKHMRKQKEGGEEARCGKEKPAAGVGEK